MEAEIAQGKVTTIIGVPGMWPDRSAIIRAVTKSNMGEYLLAGRMLMHLPTRHGFEFEIYPHDPNLRRAFLYAGQGWITEPELARIDAHRHTVYILGPGGNLDNSRDMMQAANSIVKAGGLAVKVESTGKAFRSDDWARMCEGKGPLVLYDAYVVFSVDNEDEQFTVYSCGMHNMGYHDAIITSKLPPQEAVALLDTFLKYLLVEQPAIGDGHTFSIAPDAPTYRLHLEPCTLYPADDPFFNPFGMWRLKGKDEG